MTDSRQFKVTERSTPHSTVRAGQQARASMAGERSADDEVVRVILAAHDAAPSDLTEAVEALVRAGKMLESLVADFLAADSAGDNDELDEATLCDIQGDLKSWMYKYREANQRLKTIAPDFYKQAMEGGDDR